MRTRQEHIDWCKSRANELLDSGNPQEAITSMLSDLSKHEDTAAAGKAMGMMGLMAIANGSESEARCFINGFN